MRITLFFLLALTPMAAFAQETAFGSPDRFSAELSSLKSSADQLAAGNTALAAQNAALRARISQQQARLQQMAQENSTLTRSTLVLQDINPSRAKKITALEREVFDADTAVDQTTEQMKKGNEAIKRLQDEDLRLSQQITALGGKMVQPTPVAVPVAPAAPDVAASHAKEKLRLLKMIADSKKRQQEFYRQMDNSLNRRPAEVVTVETSNQKQMLTAQIAQAQEEVLQLTKMTQQPLQDQGLQQDQMRQLEVQVNALQKNHDELENLVSRMQQKAQHAGASPQEQNKEEKRLQGSLDDITKESRILAQDLHDLRQKMVELDKRKTSLESLLSR